MSSSNRLPCDPHPKKTKKPWASAAAARLLLLRGGRAAAKDESIEFFSALRLRECNPDPPISGQTGRGAADRKGKARRSAGDSGELLVSAEIGKHDYDWLLTPPATRVSSPATSGAAAAALNRLARPTSASHAKSNSPLSLTARRENRNPTASRLARSSSAPDTPALASYGRPSHVRTLSSAASSSSSINAASIASGSSTRTLPAGSTATSPRTPATKDSKARRRPSKVNQLGWTSNSSRPRAPTTGAESTRVTSSETEQRPALAAMARRANAVARSRFATTRSTSTGQTAHNASRPSSSVKPRPVPVAAAERWRRQSPSTPDGTQTHQSASGSRGLVAKRSPRNGGKASVVDKDKPAPQRSTAGVAASAGAMRSGASRKPPANNSDAKPRRRADAFPSTRYDAMLLREDPKNLTWLNGGCGDDDDVDDGSYRAGLVEGSLEPFHVPAGVLK
ncbi:mucin-1-like [Brachypodium distachyon]|uniref:mucin-1-like n=1 Tax=Brachypodium distachyon TaxID=15368 RepID=UPI0001C7210A|nr:mucin-1-like [Brachypodium distachyon]|eukprot:XP_024315624.1 mucin-1-like [Brachypodium distachyon]